MELHQLWFAVYGLLHWATIEISEEQKGLGTSEFVFPFDAGYQQELRGSDD
jgi:hypothetical protein